MCVSYRVLNKVVKPFKYPIPCCDNFIKIIGIGASNIYIVTVDANQGYHQISVYYLYRYKLAFFEPNNRKYTFKVVPFGTMNDPGFYTCIMQYFSG